MKELNTAIGIVAVEKFLDSKSFDDWMDEVDDHISSRYGLTSADIEDMPYRNFYEDGMSPEEVLDEVAGTIDY